MAATRYPQFLLYVTPKTNLNFPHDNGQHWLGTTQLFSKEYNLTEFLLTDVLTDASDQRNLIMGKIMGLIFLFNVASA